MLHKVKTYAEVLVAALCMVGFGAACGSKSSGSTPVASSDGTSNPSSPTTSNTPTTNGSPTVSNDSATITVNGLVLDEDGNPVTTEAVLIPGLPPTGTDGNGKFTIPGVTPPYDLVVIKDSKKLAFIYKGLTRADPTAFIWTQDDNQTRLATRAAIVDGFFSYGSIVTDPTFINFASKEINQWYDPDAQVGVTASAGLFSSGTYESSLEWNGPVTTVGQFLGLQYSRDPTSQLPTAYWYDYQPGVTVLSGQCTIVPATGACDPLAPISPTNHHLVGPRLFLRPTATDTVQGTITTPGQYTIVDKFVGLQFPGGINFFAFHEGPFGGTNGDSNFNYIVPDIAGATTQVCVNTTDNLFAGARSITCDAVTNDDGVLPVVIREAPEPLFPVNHAELVTYDTVFQWKAVGDSKPIHVVKFALEDRTRDDIAPTFYIITSGTTVKIPDLTSIGMGLLSDTDYVWSVRGIGPFASIDAFMTYPVPVPPLNMVPPLEAAFPGFFPGLHTSGNELAPVPDVFWTKSQTYKFGTADNIAPTSPE